MKSALPVTANRKWGEKEESFAAYSFVKERKMVRNPVQD